MSNIEIILPDNSIKTFNHEPSALEVAASIGANLARDTVGAKINGSKDITDLRMPLKSGTRIELVTVKKDEGTDIIRHTAAHIMAQAVQELWPDVKVTIGPVVEDGFYYDFDAPRPLTEDDFEAIEKKMKQIVDADYPITREVWSQEKAVEVFSKKGERFKVELINDLNDVEISIYKQGDWFDLCRGPHVQRTGQVKAFKLMSVAGAYWRGDEKNPQLQRVYGTAFAEKKLLEEHLQRYEEAKKRDHRKLGKELELFMLHPLSPAAPFFTARGTIIYQQLVNYLREMYFKYDYNEVITPQVFDVELFKQSGHIDNYRENMFFTQVDERDFSLKPMNCPGHCVLFGSTKHSYRALPYRMADFGRLHRYERAGVSHGITRVRSFCQDDAHIFCSLEQLESEISGFMSLLNEIYSKLGMSEYKIYFSTRPEKRMGSEEVWDMAEGALEGALKSLNLPYEINAGDGAFYGPKLDIMFVDALKRPWQLGTIQCDFNLPERFDLNYIGEDNKEHRPVMLHRAVLGSLERFIGVYLEHTAGHFPTWLAPTQVIILNVTDRVGEFCDTLKEQFKDAGIRAEYDSRSEKLNYKIREAQLKKIPYMLIIGDREAEAKKVSVRLNNGKVINDVDVSQFISDLSAEISERRLKAMYGDS